MESYIEDDCKDNIVRNMEKDLLYMVSLYPQTEDFLHFQIDNFPNI